MPATTDVGFIGMQIAKVVGFGPPLAEELFQCVVLDEVSADRHLVISIGEREAFSLAARLQGVEFGRPMTYGTTAVFLEYFGLRSLEDLPVSDELRRIVVQKPEALVTAEPGLATAPPEQLADSPESQSKPDKSEKPPENPAPPG